LTLKKWFAAFFIFVIGLVIGAFAQHELGNQLFPSGTEQTWRQHHNEDSTHLQIMAFQDALDALRKEGTPSADALSQQIDLQTKIEGLIIQSRAAQYANLTPFTSFSSSAVTLLIGLAGLMVGWLGKKHGAS